MKFNHSGSSWQEKCRVWGSTPDAVQLAERANRRINALRNVGLEDEADKVEEFFFMENADILGGLITGLVAEGVS